jgi:hypothetical protein
VPSAPHGLGTASSVPSVALKDRRRQMPHGTIITEVSVLYPYKAESRFDHDYYQNQHVPLIAERLGAGLLFSTNRLRDWER